MWIGSISALLSPHRLVNRIRTHQAIEAKTISNGEVGKSNKLHGVLFEEICDFNPMLFRKLNV